MLHPFYIYYTPSSSGEMAPPGSVTTELVTKLSTPWRAPLSAPPTQSRGRSGRGAGVPAICDSVGIYIRLEITKVGSCARERERDICIYIDHCRLTLYIYIHNTYQYLTTPYWSCWNGLFFSEIFMILALTVQQKTVGAQDHPRGFCGCWNQSFAPLKLVPSH